MGTDVVFLSRIKKSALGSRKICLCTTLNLLLILSIFWRRFICCIIKIPKVADKNGESCISILEKIAG